MFIMPIATISTFTSLVMVSHVISGWFSKLLDVITRIRAVGFTWNLSSPSFDWFFINTGVMTLVVMTALTLTLIILFLSLKMADGKFKFSRGLFYYLFIYAFLTPLWIVKALFDTVFKRKVSWR